MRPRPRNAPNEPPNQILAAFSPTQPSSGCARGVYLMDLLVNEKEQMQGSSPVKLTPDGVFRGCLVPLSSSSSPSCAAGRRARGDMGTATSPRVRALGPTSHTRTALVTGSARNSSAGTEPSNLRFSGCSFLAVGLHK